MKLQEWRWALRFAFVALQGLLVLMVLEGYRLTAAGMAIADALICSGVAIYLSRQRTPKRSRNKRASRWDA